MRKGPPLKSALEESRTFESRRNIVSLEKGRIKKVFSDAEAAHHEWNILMLLYKRGVAVPEVLELRENVLYLQYCPGPLLLDRVLALEHKNSAESLNNLCTELADWFDRFYQAVPGHIRGDVNFRNFIVGVSGVIGIDFEALPTGQKEMDMGAMLAYYAAYSPAFTTQRTRSAAIMFNVFSEKILLDKNKVLEEIHIAFKRMKKRRKCFDTRIAESWLSSFEKEVWNEG